MRKILTALAAVALTIPLVAPASAQSGFAWQYDRQLDADPLQSRLVLSYGVPETDNVQFTAQCQIGAGGTYVTFDIGAVIGDLPAGQTVQVEFTGTGFHEVITGTIVRPQDEGITGVEFAVETNDGIWQAIRGLSEIYYNVVGYTALSLGLHGSSAPTAQFISDCQTMPGPGGAATVSGTPAPVAPAVPAGGETLSCNVLGSLRSTDSRVPASVTFVNGTDGLRGVMWIDFNGTPQPYANLNPGQSYTQDTAVGHAWMITDGPGNCLEIYVVPAGTSQFVATAAAKDLGPE